MMVSWVEMTKQDTYKWEASRSRVYSKKGPCHTTGFSSVIEGVANQVDWREVVVADPVPKTELLPGGCGVWLEYLPC
jgi:hypothetical protein